MLIQKMRDQTSSLGFKILVGVIIFVLAVFGFGAFNLFSVGEPSVASVNGTDITTSQVAREADMEQRRIAAQLGENFDPALIDPARLQSVVIERLIGRQILVQAAQDLDLGLSERRVHETVAADPSFQVGGKFNEATYRNVLRNNGYSPQQYLHQTAELMTLNQFTEGVTKGSFVTDWELREASRFLAQTRNISFLAFSPDHFKKQVEITDEAITLYFEENQREFMTPETLSVQYVHLKLADLLQDPSIEVTEEDLQTAYETDKANYAGGERRGSTHILLNINDERTEEQAVAQLKEYRQAILDGADMAELASAHSEDPGSAGDGGRLNAMGKGIFDSAFENALWSLQKAGELSAPVKSAFGYHLIRLDSIEPDEYPSFQVQRFEIEQRLRRDQAEALLAEKVRDLDNLAFENPSSLDPIASAHGLTILEARDVTEDEGPDVFADAKARDALFTEEVIEKGYNTAAIALDDQSVLVARLIDRAAPAPRKLEEVSDTIRAQLEQQQANTLAQAAFEDASSRLESGESVLDVSRSYSLTWQTHGKVKRNDGSIPAPVLQAVFQLPPPEPGAKRVTETNLADGSPAIVTLTKVEPGVYSTLTAAELRSMRQFLEDRNAQLDLGGWFSSLERDARITRR